MSGNDPDPTAPGEEGPPPRMLSTTFWVVTGLGLLFVIAGVVVAFVGPQLAPA